ncbi:lipopolysaccharide biosynthesis protein [Mediterraneibacter gnavus]|uniref:lipopolysaccharide biosynthesis protein n=1 Tax=Mediterraneibacter gnavus TaxID=33038 RepID=UPI002AF09D79|nr:hypothetical protein [Mediterraneibacter gnavus]
MNFNKGVRNIIWSILGQIITLLIGILIPRFVIVSYGSEINGLLSSVGQVMSYLALLEAGLGAAAIQALYKPIAQSDNYKVSQIVVATQNSYRKIGGMYLIAVIVCAFVYPFLVDSKMDYWFVFVIVILFGLPSVINFFFQGKYSILINAKGDLYYITNINTIVTVLNSFIKIYLLSIHLNIIFVQFMYCVTSLVQMYFVYRYVKKNYTWLDMKVKPDYSSLKGKNSAVVHQICGLITNSTDVILLTAFCDLKAVSIYSVYNMIFNIVYMVATSVNSGVQFIFGNAFYKGVDYYKKIFNCYETYYICLTSSLMVVTFIFVKPFLILYTAGADINYVNNAFPVVFMIMKILHSYKNCATLTPSVSGYFKETQTHALIESVINLLISIIALRKFGMVGVLFGTIVAFIYRSCVDIIYTNQKILKKNSWSNVKRVVVNVLLISLYTGIILNIEITPYNYLYLLLLAIPVTIIVLSTFIVVNSICNIDEFFMVRDFVSRKCREIYSARIKPWIHQRKK